MLTIIKTSLFLGVRGTIRGNKGIAILTVLMMSLIYVNLLFLPSLIQGNIDNINDQVINTTTSNLVITPKDGSNIDNLGSYEQDVQKIDLSARLG